MDKKTNVRSRLIKLRKEKGYTQGQMANLLGVVISCYSNYENGYRNPSFKVVLKLKKILQVSEDDFFISDSDTKSI